MFNIFVVDDNPNTRRLTSAILRQNGYAPIEAVDGVDALNKMESHHVDLILLDVMMPNMDGYELTQTLRATGNNVPILMVTAKEAQVDKRLGFLAGTDDYMVKPVDEEEMLLRIAALLRRAKIANERRIVVGNTVLDYDAFTVSSDGAPIILPQKEFLILYLLMSYPGKIFTRRQLMDEIWDMESESDERTVDVHINRVRDKFRDNTDFEIVTVRGLGYKAVKREETV
ncbi:MAG: response regulator transcription factor [Clostridia bacterium]|nr:response regulator transcription factor [Clostridia bacterium]